jgi:hypothetical protein
LFLPRDREELCSIPDRVVDDGTMNAGVDERPLLFSGANKTTIVKASSIAGLPRKTVGKNFVVGHQHRICVRVRTETLPSRE